jgi:hypothetical protein
MNRCTLGTQLMTAIDQALFALVAARKLNADHLIIQRRKIVETALMDYFFHKHSCADCRNAFQNGKEALCTRVQFNATAEKVINVTIGI